MSSLRWAIVKIYPSRMIRDEIYEVGISNGALGGKPYLCQLGQENGEELFLLETSYFNFFWGYA